MGGQWNGRQCQQCGRFANHFFVLDEDDGSKTYSDERCLTGAERERFDGLLAIPGEGEK